GDGGGGGRGLGGPAASWNVRDRDQPGAWPDRALERQEVELPRRVTVDHVDLDAGTRLHLEKGEIVRQVFGPRGDHAIARPERNGVEGHVPGARGVLDHRDLVRPRADQRGDGVIDV